MGPAPARGRHLVLPLPDSSTLAKVAQVRRGEKKEATLNDFLLIKSNFPNDTPFKCGNVLAVETASANIANH